jgi:hypothetical protein
MATSTNMLLQNLSGKLGDMLVIKQYAGKTVVTKAPNMSKRKLSPKQLLNNQRMAEANEEVQRIMRDEEMRDKAQLRLNVTRSKLYHALIREYFTAFRTEK